MRLNLIHKKLLYLFKPLGWLYIIWKYKLPKPLKKFEEISRLTYNVLTKGNKILVIYTKRHPIYENIAYYAPEGVKFVGLTSSFKKKNFFLEWLISKVDILYEDGANPLSLTTNRPIVKYFEHPHFGERVFNNPQVKKIFIRSRWARPNHPDPEHKVEVLYPSLPVTPQKVPKDQSQITIFLAGSAASCKGADIVYQAFEQVEAKLPGKQLFLIMASNYKQTVNWYPTSEACQKRLHDIYKKCQKKNNVYFSGIYPPGLIRLLYEQVDIYVQPSRFDSFGFSLMEAISYGLPVIATTINAFPEMIEHGRNGFLIDTQDFDLQSEEYFEYAVKEMEKYLIQLVESPDLRQKMGEESRKRVQRKFNLDYQKNRLKTLFQEIIKKAKLP